MHQTDMGIKNTLRKRPAPKRDQITSELLLVAAKFSAYQSSPFCCELSEEVIDVLLMVLFMLISTLFSVIREGDQVTDAL